MIYFVDEDMSWTDAYRVELVLRGWEVGAIRTATQALADLGRSTVQPQLVFIDVMLAVGIGPAARFATLKQEDYQVTGLLLLESLCKARPDVFPERAVLLTAATTQRVVDQAEDLAARLPVPLLKKTDYLLPSSLADEAEDMLQKLGESKEK